VNCDPSDIDCSGVDVEDNLTLALSLERSGNESVVQGGAG